MNTAVQDAATFSPEDQPAADVIDFVEALRADLTSYRFSSAGMARAMIHQILAPSRSHATMRPR